MKFNSKARVVRGSRLICLLLLIASPLSAMWAQSSADIVFDPGGLIRVTGWPEAARLPSQQWPQILSVRVDANDVPPLLGTHRIEGAALVFAPRYALQAGLRYRATLSIPGRPAIIRIFDIPKEKVDPTTVIETVYPSINVIPENQLKFYIHFSAPMSRGEAYERTHLLDENGKRIELPFLELPEELWDYEYRRLTLLFDPGRIKRGLVPHNEVGVPLVPGKKYTLVIDREWIDAEGKPLKEGFRKSFSVTEADRKVIDLKTWRLQPPKAGTSDTFAVDFPEPLDHALLERHLEVVDANGNIVAGTRLVDRQETRWLLTPASPWKPGNYSLRVGTVLADLAGNMIDRPFDVDVFEKVDERIIRETKVIPFTVK